MWKLNFQLSLSEVNLMIWAHYGQVGFKLTWNVFIQLVFVHWTERNFGSGAGSMIQAISGILLLQVFSRLFHLTNTAGAGSWLVLKLDPLSAWSLIILYSWNCINLGHIFGTLSGHNIFQKSQYNKIFDKYLKWGGAIKIHQHFWIIFLLLTFSWG